MNQSQLVDAQNSLASLMSLVDPTLDKLLSYLDKEDLVSETRPFFRPSSLDSKLFRPWFSASPTQTLAGFRRFRNPARFSKFLKHNMPPEGLFAILKAPSVGYTLHQVGRFNPLLVFNRLNPLADIPTSLSFFTPDQSDLSLVVSRAPQSGLEALAWDFSIGYWIRLSSTCSS